MQRPHGGKDPQSLRVEGVTAPLRDAVVVDGGVRQASWPHWRNIGPGIDRYIAGKAAASLGGAGVGVEVGVAAAHRAPVEQTLIFRVGELVEHPV